MNKKNEITLTEIKKAESLGYPVFVIVNGEYYTLVEEDSKNTTPQNYF